MNSDDTIEPKAKKTDPFADRVVKEIEPPPSKPLADELLFPKKNGVPDWKVLRDHLCREGRVKKEHCLDLIKRVTNIVGQEPNLLRLKDPITVVGDIHGQYYDFVKLLDVGGDPEVTQYVFLGDYVDRGSFSIECLLLLYALKINFPTRIWMLRGNHECRQMTAFFNFRDECEYKFDLAVYTAFMESFDTLPVSATINGKFLAVHGGLSPDLRTISQVSNLHRFNEPPRNGLFCDLLWSDPVDEEKEEHTAISEPYFPNDVRGCSFFFGYEAASTFLEKNGLLSVIRAHEAQLEGYKMHQTNTKTGFPTVITIFSAPNYCDCYNNKGAVLKFENNTLNIQQFNFSSHPYHLPNFMDVFTWSIPFVSEKVTEILYAILNPSVEDDEEDEEIDKVVLPNEVLKMWRRSVQISENEASEMSLRLTESMKRDTSGAPPTPPKMTGRTVSRGRADALRRKVQSVSRLMRMFRTLREENETIVQLKGLTPGSRIPPGLLLQGGEALQSELSRFQRAKAVDLLNEKRPNV
eukprot:Platyproteum_vivax@DN4888_c0_g1_i1.p1